MVARTPLRRASTGSAISRLLTVLAADRLNAPFRCQGFLDPNTPISALSVVHCSFRRRVLGQNSRSDNKFRHPGQCNTQLLDILMSMSMRNGSAVGWTVGASCTPAIRANSTDGSATRLSRRSSKASTTFSLAMEAHGTMRTPASHGFSRFLRGSCRPYGQARIFPCRFSRGTLTGAFRP